MSLLFNFNQTPGPVTGWTQIGTNALYSDGSKAVVQTFDVSPAGDYSSALDMTALMPTLGTTFQVDFDAVFPLVIGDGGVLVGLVNTSAFSGYGVFVGNAAHIYQITPGFGFGTYLTNADISSSGDGSRHVTFTRDGATGDMKIYLDGTLWAAATDSTYTPGPGLWVWQRTNGSSTGTPASIDNLLISDTITGPPAPPTQSTAFAVRRAPRALMRRK